MTTSLDPLAGGSSAAPLDARSQRWTLVAMITALVAVVSAMSGLNVAQQHMALEFGASQGAILWVINGYTLALAAFLLPVGAIGDRWGRKPVLVCGLVVFAVAGVAAAIAGSVTMMIVARVVAGLGASMIMPATLSIITSSFPPDERARAIGVWAGFAGAGGMIGLFVSSLMVDVLSWRWVFALPLCLVAVSLPVTVRFAPNSRESREHAFDVIGSVLAAIAIGSVVLGVHEGPERGWSNALTIIGLVAGAVAAITFVAWERQHPDPLLDVSAFADRALAAGSVTMLAMFTVTFGIFVVLFPYMQAVLGWSALHSAAGMLPMSLVMLPLSATAPQLAGRHGKRPVMLVGIAVFAGGLVVLAVRASVEGGYLSVLPGLLLVGVGMGLAMTPSTQAITESLPSDKQGVASAINDTTRELGGAVGVALLGSVMSAGYRSAIRPDLAGLPAEVAAPAAEGIGSALGVAGRAGAAGATIIDAAQHALVAGWVRAMWLGVAVALAALAHLVLRGPFETASADPAVDTAP